MISENIHQLARLFHLNGVFGTYMKTIKNVSQYCYNLVFGLPENSVAGDLQLQQFTCEAENILSLPMLSLQNTFKYVVVSDNVNCRKCGRALKIDNNFKIITVYDFSSGTSIGRRFVKACRKCSITESCTYYSENGKRFYDFTQDNEISIFQSTEDTAFTTKTLEFYNHELVIGHMSFLTKANIYNAMFDYTYSEGRPLKKKR